MQQLPRANDSVLQEEKPPLHVLHSCNSQDAGTALDLEQRKSPPGNHEDDEEGLPLPASLLPCLHSYISSRGSRHFLLSPSSLLCLFALLLATLSLHALNRPWKWVGSNPFFVSVSRQCVRAWLEHTVPEVCMSVSLYTLQQCVEKHWAERPCLSSFSQPSLNTHLTIATWRANFNRREGMMGNLHHCVSHPIPAKEVPPTS